MNPGYSKESYEVPLVYLAGLETLLESRFLKLGSLLFSKTSILFCSAAHSKSTLFDLLIDGLSSFQQESVGFFKARNVIQEIFGPLANVSSAIAFYLFTFPSRH